MPQTWLELVHYYMTGTLQIPVSPSAPLRGLLDEIRTLQLDRQPITFKDTIPTIKETGMSPKKAHEVSRMAAYIFETIRVNSWSPSALRIVDVGAGQGYLTRTLKAHLPKTRILALDADEEQTLGAQRWEGRLLPPPSSENPPITHKTIHITPEGLYATVDEWISVTSAPSPNPGGMGGANHIPVLLVGLHACGSLTPDILRTFYQSGNEPEGWKFAGVVVVGCCYNLMNPGDFPLSKQMRSFSTIDLPTSAYHLAAQIPTQWLSSLSPPTPIPSVELALRKVTWRALLGQKLRRTQNDVVSSDNDFHLNLAPGRQLPWSRLPVAKTQNFDINEVGTGATPEMRRLGRLRDAAYKDWETFLGVAGKKMGVDFSTTGEGTGAGRDVVLEKFLEIVHTLRCLLGPVVETTIVLDRVGWINENLRLKGYADVQASIVNLFDQATGSGRNIAIVIAPSIPSMS
ncbi:hypothetical protein P691DRAFT_754327 [Macrolepiota fuliginosa MF-IS2]|uniref:Methyltransferase domain-containing protein n=1 Tax=Macrolepiota fuliginosa MF-IS2 TaxID=1400762 RepID=A0A9P5XPY1_9AGAR|nr:hypothetical protein P691DRAFT_754327 [Macrolepiota fuliginosa MF-IS2]